LLQIRSLKSFICVWNGKRAW